MGQKSGKFSFEPNVHVTNRQSKEATNGGPTQNSAEVAKGGNGDLDVPHIDDMPEASVLPGQAEDAPVLGTRGIFGEECNGSPASPGSGGDAAGDTKSKRKKTNKSFKLVGLRLFGKHEDRKKAVGSGDKDEVAHSPSTTPTAEETAAASTMNPPTTVTSSSVAEAVENEAGSPGPASSPKFTSHEEMSNMKSASSDACSDQDEAGSPGPASSPKFTSHEEMSNMKSASSDACSDQDENNDNTQQ